MCMISILPPLSEMEKEMDFDMLRIAHEKNKDGNGFAFVSNLGTSPNVIINKGLMNINTFIKSLSKTRKRNRDSYFLVHQRNSTAGQVTFQNCHPFFVNGVAMAHNGTIPKLKTYGKPESDSSILAAMLREMPEKWYEEDIYYDLLHSFIGGFNRIAILSPKNVVNYIGDTGWHKIDNGVIFSNEYYKKQKPITPVDTTNIQEIKTPYESYGDDWKCEVCGKQGWITHLSHVLCEECDTQLKNKEKCPCCKDGEITLVSELKDGVCMRCRRVYGLDYVGRGV